MTEEKPETFLPGANLGNLTSKIKFYDRVDGWSNSCSYSERNEELVRAKSKLQLCTEVKDEVDKVAGALCHVSTEKRDAEDDTYVVYAYGTSDTDDLEERFNKSLCDFLYFWLGTEVWNKVDNSSTKFLSNMKCIYEALEQFDVKDNCKNMYTDNINITKELFNHWKNIFDFSFDYPTIKQKLKDFKNSCDEGYYQYLQQAEKAFKNVSADCKNKKDAYCSNFKKEYEDKNNEGPLILNNTSEEVIKVESRRERVEPTEGQATSEDVKVYRGVNLELKYTTQYMQELAEEKARRRAQAQVSARGHKSDASKHAPAITQEWDPYLSGLPSKRMYETLNFQHSVPKSSTVVSPIENKLKGILTQYQEMSASIDKIVHAWYYVNQGMNSDRSPSYDQRCEYFYFCLGDILPEELKNDSSFQNVMKEVYDKLRKQDGTDECNLIYSSVKKEQFEQMKKLYNHSQDYTTIKHRLQQNGSLCTEKLKQYMDDIFKTYDKVKTECSGTSPSPADSTYCEKFKEKYEKQCSRELAQLSCSHGISTTAAAISSILGIVGLPAIATFLLYKYNLLPHWFLNKFGGRGRRSRRSERSNFDTLTDSSTEYSADYSSVASRAASTIDDSTDVSTIYNRLPRRTGTNNRRPQQNRNNISYGRM